LPGSSQAPLAATEVGHLFTAPFIASWIKTWLMFSRLRYCEKATTAQAQSDTFGFGQTGAQSRPFPSRLEKAGLRGWRDTAVTAVEEADGGILFLSSSLT